MARNNFLMQLNSLQELKATIASVEGDQARLLGSVVSRQAQLNKEESSLNSSLATLTEQLSFRTLRAPSSGKVFIYLFLPICS